MLLLDFYSQHLKEVNERLCLWVLWPSDGVWSQCHSSHSGYHCNWWKQLTQLTQQTNNNRLMTDRTHWLRLALLQVEKRICKYCINDMKEIWLSKLTEIRIWGERNTTDQCLGVLQRWTSHVFILSTSRIVHSLEIFFLTSPTSWGRT